MATRKFSNKKSYNKWVAYGHIHKVMNNKGRIKVKIGGKMHKVDHSKER